MRRHWQGHTGQDGHALLACARVRRHWQGCGYIQKQTRQNLGYLPLSIPFISSWPLRSRTQPGLLSPFSQPPYVRLLPRRQQYPALSRSNSQSPLTSEAVYVVGIIKQQRDVERDIPRPRHTHAHMHKPYATGGEGAVGGHELRNSVTPAHKRAASRARVP